MTRETDLYRERHGGFTVLRPARLTGDFEIIHNTDGEPLGPRDLHKEQDNG